MPEPTLDKVLKFDEMKMAENNSSSLYANDEDFFKSSGSDAPVFAPQRDDEDLEQRWAQLLFDMTVRFGKQPDLNALLFLIGLQEMGHGTGTYTKEQKQDLMHIGTCTIFSISGFYEFVERDADGWPHFRSVKPIPNLPLKEQERLLKWHILEYFG